MKILRKSLGLMLAFAFVISTFAMIVPVMGDVIPPVQVYKKPGTLPNDPPATASQLMDWGYLRIGADTARTTVAGVETIHVAVLDTGVDYEHADLAGVVTWCYDAINRAEGCTRKSADDDGHGTHVAGTIAALDNEQDSVGAAAGFVEIYNVKVLGRRGGDWYDLAHGIEMATKGPDGIAGTFDDADVISMSLGGDISSAPDLIQVLQNSIDYAISYGTIVVAAAGNEGTCESGDVQYSWPAMNDGVITVGATGIYKDGAFATQWTGAEEDVMPCFSNEMPAGVVDISAPGVYITALKKGGGTTEMSGTSMATPYISAVIALMLANGVAPSNIYNRLTSTAIDIGYPSTMMGAGLVNAAAAV